MHLLTITEACARLKVSRPTLLAMRKAGEIRAINRRPHGKKGSWLIDLDSLKPEPQEGQAIMLDILKRAGL